MSEPAIFLNFPIVPVSVNKMYVGRVRLSKEAARCKGQIEMLARCMLNSNGIKPFTGDVVVTIHVYRARKTGDLDNFQKLLLDALNGIAYNDDKQIVELHAYRRDDKNDPRVEIVIEEALAVIGTTE